MKNREAFSQKILNQAYIAGGADAAGRSILEGSKVAAESVIPNMMASTTGLLASMAQGNKSIAAATICSGIVHEPVCAYELYLSTPAPSTISPLSDWLIYI